MVFIGLQCIFGLHTIPNIFFLLTLSPLYRVITFQKGALKLPNNVPHLALDGVLEFVVIFAAISISLSLSYANVTWSWLYRTFPNERL